MNNIENIEEFLEEMLDKLKEVGKESKAKTKRIKSLEINLSIVQSKNTLLQESSKELEKQSEELAKENLLLRETVQDLEIESIRTSETAKLDLKSEKDTVEQLRSKCEKYELELKEKEALISAHENTIKEKDMLIDIQADLLKEAESLKEEKVSKERDVQLDSEITERDLLLAKQQLMIDALSVENTRFKKISKKYAKTINTVSPQAINNIRFVRKFPLLESRCNSLIEQLDKVERERDHLLSRALAGTKRPATSSAQYNTTQQMDRNAQIMQQFSPAARAAARQPIPISSRFQTVNTTPIIGPSTLPAFQLDSRLKFEEQQQQQQQQPKNLSNNENTVIMPMTKRQKIES